MSEPDSGVDLWFTACTEEKWRNIFGFLDFSLNNLWIFEFLFLEFLNFAEFFHTWPTFPLLVHFGTGSSGSPEVQVSLGPPPPPFAPAPAAPFPCPFSYFFQCGYSTLLYLVKTLSTITVSHIRDSKPLLTTFKLNFTGMEAHRVTTNPLRMLITSQHSSFSLTLILRRIVMIHFIIHLSRWCSEQITHPCVSNTLWDGSRFGFIWYWYCSSIPIFPYTNHPLASNIFINLLCPIYVLSLKTILCLARVSTE